MAEDKYDLLLVPTRNDDRTIYEQPWYKERLRTKYLKSLKPSDTSKVYNGKNWTFLKDGLDDFRDGLPPDTNGTDFIKGTKGLMPNIHGSSSSSSVKQPAVKKRFNKYHVCYSKSTPMQQSKRDQIDEIEYGLVQHPLALYPHLEESIPPEIFEEVIDILDPEMNVEDSEMDEESYGDGEEQEESTREQHTPQIRPESAQSNRTTSDEARMRNPYRWLPRREEKEKRDKRRAQERRSTSPSQDEHIKTVTKDFCDWVASLGGESNNIEESTITSLFASGYETKPALSVPIHVVELTNVPPELRVAANMPTPPSTAQTSSEKKKVLKPRKNWVYSGTYEPSWTKFKYGAWYLDPQTWEKRNEGEPLRDPKELKNEEMSEAKKKSNALDTELAPMHGANAFKDFIDRKSVRRPEFLDRVSDIQQQVAKEEEAQREAERRSVRKQKSRSATAASEGALKK